MKKVKRNKTSIWKKKKREKILRAQKGVCNMCKRNTTDLGWMLRFTIDHIVPLIDGGNWKEYNLQVLCTACHERKTEEENTKFGRRRMVMVRV